MPPEKQETAVFKTAVQLNLSQEIVCHNCGFFYLPQRQYKNHIPKQEKLKS